jgi:hypothetical protein
MVFMRYPDRFKANNVISESTLTRNERDHLTDSDFGIPEERKYPLNDEVHVIQAVRFFKDAPEKYRTDLAKRIVSKAKKYNMDWERWDVIKPYIDETVTESFDPNRYPIESTDDIYKLISEFDNVPESDKPELVRRMVDAGKSFNMNWWVWFGFEKEAIDYRGKAFTSRTGMTPYLKYLSTSDVMTYHDWQDNKLKKLRTNKNEKINDPYTTDEYDDGQYIEESFDSMFKNMNDNFINESVDSTLVKVENLKFDKLYIGSPTMFLGDCITYKSLRFYLTPFKGVASLYTCDDRKYLKGIHKCNVSDIIFKELSLPTNRLNEKFDDVHVEIVSNKEYPDRRFENTGYIYEVDISDYKDKIYRDTNLQSEHIYMIKGTSRLKILNREICESMQYVSYKKAKYDDQESFMEYSGYSSDDYVEFENCEACRIKCAVSGINKKNTEERDNMNYNKSKIKSISEFITESESTSSKKTNDDNDDMADIEDDDVNDVDDVDYVDNDDDDLINFGKDDSDEQNEYDPKEVERLNNLISSESAGMDEYFDASKETNVDILRRLYSDIGNEERFHQEQLLYAKSVLTGDKYEPRDPDVKKEYEELLEMGVDEETAMVTAIDKTNIISGDDGDDSDIEDLEEDMNMLEAAFTQFSSVYDMMEIINESGEYKNNDELIKQYDMFFEAYIMEDVDNMSDNSTKQLMGGTSNPIKLIARAIRAIYKFIISIVKKIKMYINKMRIKNKRRMLWIKKHGIKGLFQSGVKLYFYSDKTGTYNTDDGTRYLFLLTQLTYMISQNAGISDISEPKFPSNIQTIHFRTISDGLNMLKGVVLSKSKLIVTDQNESQIAEDFFGYTEEKSAKTVRDADGKVVSTSLRSKNLFNALESVAEYAVVAAKQSDIVITTLANMEGDVNSIYSTDRSTYNKCVSAMKVVADGFNKFIKAISADMNTIMKINNDLYNMTRAADDAVSRGETPNIPRNAYEDQHKNSTTPKRTRPTKTFKW